MEVKLIVVNGKQAGKEIPVSVPKFLIGRGEECQIRPQSSLVSRKHCAILIEEGSVVIEDLHSTNGTFVNDAKLLQRYELKNGDRIKVGMLDLEVRLPVSTVAEARPLVQSIPVAARANAAIAVEDDLDVSRWLEEDNGQTVMQPSKQPMKSGDTNAGKSMFDTGTMPTTLAPQKKEEPKQEDAKKKMTPAKTGGKIPPPAKTARESSGAAADDALRNFFHRKKS